MGMLVQFVPRHGRTSAGSRSSTGRAARSAKSSAVKPASLATSVESIADHHSAGMVSRWRHLCADQRPAPTSDAMASIEDHNAITSRKELIGTTMPNPLGQSVLKGKANLSYDHRSFSADSSNMAERMSETEERLAFIRRVRMAREARFPSQKPIMVILGISQEQQGTYKQYETRTPLPHRYILKFCAATGVSVEWLLTGEGEGPVPITPPRLVSSRAKGLPRGRKKRQSAGLACKFPCTLAYEKTKTPENQIDPPDGARKIIDRRTGHKRAHQRAQNQAAEGVFFILSPLPR
jgi:hypothetical protein